MVQPVREKTDERCWIRCRQTNASRSFSHEPSCTMYCYLNLRHRMTELKQLATVPGAFVARDLPVDPPKAVTEAETNGVPAYHWPWLDGRYFYIARGLTAIDDHMDDIADPSFDISALEKRCEAQNAEAEAFFEKLTPGSVHDAATLRKLASFNQPAHTLISFSDLYSRSLQRLHAHVLRIYSPVFNMLSRYPETFTDGTQLDALNLMKTKLTDGSAFALVGRMYESTVRVAGVLNDIRKTPRGPGDRPGSVFGRRPPDASPPGDGGSLGPNSDGTEGPAAPVPSEPRVRPEKSVGDGTT